VVLARRCWQDAAMRLVLCTVPDEPTAARLAHTLVEEGLAACVNRLPVGSTYAWQGRICEDNEVLLLIKTGASRYAALEARLLELHPYDLPEVVAFDTTVGLDRYFAWVESSTRRG
jgi:periplasmic divalent cation tolerance protein